MPKTRIGILTGGGDVPGLNSVIKGVVYRGNEVDIEVVGIRRGWEGLTHVDFDDAASVTRYIYPLTRENTRTIDRYGGTFLHTTRTNPAKMRTVPEHLAGRTFEAAVTDKGTTWDVSPAVLENLERLRLDYLIAIGGDDTLSYAAQLDKLGFKVVAIPKTMDNDVRNTEYCIGFSTAITRATDAVQRQRTTIGSHERIGVFRIFGRDAGFTALYTAYVTSVRCGIPELRFDASKMVELLLEDKKNNPSSYSLLLLSEGARWDGFEPTEYGEPDAYGHRKKQNVGDAFSEVVHKQTGSETMVSDLTYDLRSGAPDFVDKLVATAFGNMALDAILTNQSGVMTAIVTGCYALMPIPEPKLGPRQVDLHQMYNKDRYRPNYAHHLGLPIFLSRA